MTDPAPVVLENTRFLGIWINDLICVWDCIRKSTSTGLRLIERSGWCRHESAFAMTLAIARLGLIMALQFSSHGHAAQQANKIAVPVTRLSYV